MRICGELVLMRLEAIGVTRLADLRSRDAWELGHEVNLSGRHPIWCAAPVDAALQNLIDAAERESTGPPARGEAVHGGL